MDDRFEIRLAESNESETLSVSEVIAREQRIEASGTTLLTLMRRAGAAVASFVRQRFPQPCKVLIVCGTGNNGGDGWVCAESLYRHGYEVRVVTPLHAEEVAVKPACEAAMHAASALPANCVIIQPGKAYLEEIARSSVVIVDAMLGTGFSHSSVREPLSSWIDACNRARSEKGSFIVAVDAPSGLSAQTGEAALPCIIADATVTMIAQKIGLTTERAKPYCGDIAVAMIHAD